MNDALEGTAAQVADMLFDRGAVKFAGVAGAPQEGFKLKLHEKEPDAPLSPIYLNIRGVGHKDGTLLPEDFDLIAALLGNLIDAFCREYEYLAGIPVAGEPIADALMRKYSSMQSNVRQLHFRKQENQSERRIGEIQEDVEADRRIVLVDHLITKADTKLEAISVCEAFPLEVEAVVVLVDRQQGGISQIESAGHEIVAALKLSELLSYYVETARIDQAKADEVEQYLKKSRG